MTTPSQLNNIDINQMLESDYNNILSNQANFELQSQYPSPQNNQNNQNNHNHIQNHNQIQSNTQQFDNKLNQVCSLLLQLTKEQRETNLLLRKLIHDETSASYKLVKLSNQEKYIRFLVVLENERSRPRINCPICNEDVEITTSKRGGCKQQSFCGDYIVCNECTNDSLQKIMRCSVCCELYSKVPVPLCSHLAAVASSQNHFARKGSGNGCPLCNGKLVKEKCQHNCKRKQLPNYNMAKTILSDRVFVLVKNPEACIDNDDRPCSHYCRCSKHNILFTNRNKGAKCRECTKEIARQRQLGKRKRNVKSEPIVSTPMVSNEMQPNSKRFCNVSNSPVTTNINYSDQSFLDELNSLSSQPIQSIPQQSINSHHLQYPPHLRYSNDNLEQFNNYPQRSDNQSHNWLPLSFNDVKELGRKVSLDEILKLSDKIPYSEGVVEFGKRVTSNLSNTLGFSFPEDIKQENTNSNTNPNINSNINTNSNHLPQ